MRRWALITGEKGPAKAEVALEIVGHLRAAGLRIAGFVQRGGVDPQGRKTYELVRLATDERVRLAVDGVAPQGANEELFCSYAFDNDVFALGRRWIEADAPGCDLFLLGEVSKLEIADRGHAQSVAWALANAANRPVVLLARASQLFYVLERFGLLDDPLATLELPAADGAAEAFASSVARSCAAAPRPPVGAAQ